jgi:hypothetical protein
MWRSPKLRERWGAAPPSKTQVIHEHQGSSGATVKIDSGVTNPPTYGKDLGRAMLE